MKARTNIILMSGITIVMFLYAFLQPLLLPTNLTKGEIVNPIALVCAFLALYMDIKQIRRIRNHYRHLKFNTTDPKCQDCVTKESQ